MITLAIDEKDKHVLRVSASYLLALAGDLDVQITGADVPIKVSKTAAEIGELVRKEFVPGPTFNTDELTEAAALPIGFAGQPSPQQVFGGQQVPPPPSGVPSIVDAGASSIAPEVTPATISAPVPNVPVPPAPTPESVGIPAAPQTPAPAPGVELDARGLPWDARIHSRTKSKLGNGQWKAARNVDPALIASVEHELRNLMAIPATAPAVPTPPPLAPAAPAIVPPSIPAPPAPPASGVATASPSSFPQLMLRISGAQTARQLNQGQVSAIVSKHGLAGIAALTQRPDLIPAFVADIEAQIAANVAAGVPV